MYMFDEMIELGLKKRQKWKSPDHRIVDAAIAIANPKVTSLSTLIEVVQTINKIPKNKIKLVSMKQLREVYECPV